MPLIPVIPKIKVGTISSVLHEIENPIKNPNWKKETLERIKTHDPIIGAYLEQSEKRWGVNCVVTALVVYRIIESQIEADQMDQDFGDNHAS